MKLNFAENLRKLRHSHSMTQEQLAEKLSVSFQTVSRWETGAVYPDLEILPLLSELFDVTVDELIGCTNARREERLEKAWAEYEKIEDPEAAYAHLKSMRAEFKNDWKISEWMLRSMYTNHFHFDEMREIAMSVFNHCTDPGVRRAALTHYVAMEDEAYITDEFLCTHAGGGFDQGMLLKDRYFYRNEWDKYELQRQKNLIYQLRDMFDEGLRVAYHSSAENSVWAQKTGIGILNTLCNVPPERPVSGDGEVDLWSNERIWQGVRLSCALAATGDRDGAYAALEDTVELCEKYCALPDETELTFRCATFDGVTGKVQYHIFPDTKEGYTEIPACRDEDLIYDLWFIPPVNPLIARSGWEWFDSIRDEDRYKALVERMKRAADMLSNHG